MKSPPAVHDDCDDIFGPPRTYPTGYCPPKNRPSMISAKYRQKEERRKVLKISINKLKKIEDPEASLCRSVLINNTMKRLQKEARDEKLHKQQLNYPRYYNDNFLNIRNEFLRNEKGYSEDENLHLQDNNNETMTTDSLTNNNNKLVDFVVDSDFDAKLAEEIDTANAAKNLTDLVEENINKLNNSAFTTNCDNSTEKLSDRLSSRKRSFDDIEDCDVQDVLSQFYMPPTPRMLTCIDDDEDVNVVDVEVDEPLIKRIKIEEEPTLISINNSDSCVSNSTTSLSINNNSEVPNSDKSSTTTTTSNSMKSSGDYNSSLNNLIINNNLPSTRYHHLHQSMDTTTESNSYSCGHASMFNELQTNVYHNLIASLET